MDTIILKLLSHDFMKISTANWIIASVKYGLFINYLRKVLIIQNIINPSC